MVPMAQIGQISFNPSVGILCFRTVSYTTYQSNHRCFNPSVGILCFRTGTSLAGRGATGPFQSLGRDSVFSDESDSGGTWPVRAVSIPRSGFCVFGREPYSRARPFVIGFNPSVGILCFRTASGGAARSGKSAVSIPRSGFCVFGRRWPRVRGSMLSCFNPSVGILCFRTPLPQIDAGRRAQVSIPRSGFCVFGRKLCIPPVNQFISFNPSVGILCFRTWRQ